MEETDIIKAINHDLAIELPEKISFDELRQQLSFYINELINKDFNRLVSILYRIDISESKLKYLLKENPDEKAGELITALIIERQVQKIKSREQYNQRNKDLSDEESW